MTNPSSLIFIAIVALWAGWLVQHQIRRRQVLLTARTVETFSDAMRVLERREQAVPAAAYGGHRTSLRAGSSVFSPELAELAEVAEVRQMASGTPELPTVHEEFAVSIHDSNEVEMTAHSSATEKLKGALRRVPSVTASRRTRGITFLVVVALLPLTLIAVFAGALSSIALIGSLMLIVAVVLWLRTETLAAHRRTGQTSPARPQRRSTSHAVRHPVQRLAAPPQQAVLPVPRQEREAPVTVIVPNDAPFDAQPAPVQSHADVEGVDADDRGIDDHGIDEPTGQPTEPDGTWSPVQVPRPTYTMKVKAPERAEIAPASYENIPVEELPFDGLALDPEDEDLPSAFRAG